MGMPEVYDEIFDYAEKYIKDNSEYAPIILVNPPEETKVFPLIIITEINNTLADETLKKSEAQYRLEYEIEIYAIDKSNIPKEIIIQELKKLVNDVFDTHYGMNRRACIPTPNADRNVNRLYMRYSALIDENKIIYRR